MNIFDKVYCTLYEYWPETTE